MGINPLAVLDFLGDSLKRLVPDADKRKELEAQIRLAVIAGSSSWGPLGVSAVLCVVGLVGYLMAVAFLGRPLIYEVTLILLLIPAAAFGIDLKGWMDVRKEWRKQRDDA